MKKYEIKKDIFSNTIISFAFDCWPRVFIILKTEEETS